MGIEARQIANEKPFAPATAEFSCLVGDLESPGMSDLTFSEVESHIRERGMETLRLLLEGYLSSRGPGQVIENVVGADDRVRTHERQRGRTLMSAFGAVRLERFGYRGHGLASLYPLDGDLNLPSTRHSFGVQKSIAQEVAKNSYDESVSTIDRLTGAHVPKRQAEELMVQAGVDFDAFYDQASAPEDDSPLLVLTVDGKGIVMRPEHLRPATRRAAEAEAGSRGEPGQKAPKRRHRKRMASVAAVYGVEPFVREPKAVTAELRGSPRPVEQIRPRPKSKRVWASVEKSSMQVVEELLQEARRRDPDGKRRWVAVVDGQESQLDELESAIERHGADVTVVLDLMHVAGYVWNASSAFCATGSEAARDWVYDRVRRILEGDSIGVAAGMRRSATRRHLSAKVRAPVDICANYLLKYTEYLRYDEYLEAGLPITTGVIEGTCRSLINDRLDITGARWSVQGAEAVLRLRALMRSGDFDKYWSFREQREYARNHVARYASGIPPTVSPRAHTLRLVP